MKESTGGADTNEEQADTSENGIQGIKAMSTICLLRRNELPEKKKFA